MIVKHSLVISLFVILLAGCYPQGPDFVDELDAVYTNYDPSFNFDQAYTYSLPDGVLDINDSDLDPPGQPAYIDSKFGNAILDEIRANLDGMGWTEVDIDNQPELIILAAAFTVTNIYYDPGWWGGYYPGWGPGWGWGYPGYGPGYVSGYTTGTAIIQMTDPNNIVEDEVPVRWLSAFNGMVSGSDSYIISRIESNIDQAFEHSPF